jgi:AraC-like DNA-binding protein
MPLNFFTIVTLFSVFLTFALTLFFFVTKKGVSNENKLLAALLIIFNIQIFYSFAISYYTGDYFLGWHKPIFLLRQTSLLIGPLIYFYINAFLKKKDIFNFRILFHFLPFVSVLIFLMFYYGKIDHFIIWKSVVNLFSTMLILTHNFVYLALSVLSLKSMNYSFRDFQKNIKNAPHITWLQFLLFGFIALWVINLNTFALYTMLRNPELCAFTTSIFALTAFLFVNFIMFLLFIKPEIYYVIEKYRNNKVSEDDKMEYVRRLNSYMEKDQAYLNPDISLIMVAKAISVNPRVLSQIINETFGKNFKGYILEYRLKHSMQILADPHCRELTILEILYKVGFNNKSAFNNQFKLHTSLTPQEYRSKFIH